MDVGVVGWPCFTGTGLMSQDIARAPWVKRWLQPRHPSHETRDMSAGIDVEVFRTSTLMEQHRCESFLSGLDWIISVEHEYIPGLFGLAKRRNVGVCVVPMWEWMRHDQAFWSFVDVVWSPAEFATGQIEAIAEVRQGCGLPTPWSRYIHGGKWGVNLPDFPFRQRTVANEILFVNGQGGVMGRKGAHILAAVARRCPDVQFLFRTQTPEFPAMPKNVEIIEGDTKTRGELYDRGDVMFAPTLWEGLGLQLYECQASGLPLVCTDAEPMAQSRPAWPIDLSRQDWIQIAGKQIAKSVPNIPAAARICRNLSGTDVGIASSKAREFIESNFDLENTLEGIRDCLTNPQPAI